MPNYNIYLFYIDIIFSVYSALYTTKLKGKDK